MSVTVCDASHVRNQNMNKEVATRLFRMLAVSEQTAATVKRDHASYAKLNLLTQQMGLLQAQAQQTVNKSVARTREVEKDELKLNASCGTLSTEYDEGAKRLLTLMAIDDRTVATIKRDAPACAKLSLLAEQAGLLQQQAQQAVDESEVNRHLFEVAARITCRLVPGTMYYHYTQHGTEVVSRIADDEWDNYEEFHGKYLYDWDFTFRRQLQGKDQSAQQYEESMSWAPLLMLPHVSATPKTPVDIAGHDALMSEAQPVATSATKPAPICGVLSRW